MDEIRDTQETSRTVRQYSGCYRVYVEGADRFGQVKRDGREWVAVIRDSSTAELICYAGIWSSLADAVKEVEFTIAVDGS